MVGPDHYPAVAGSVQHDDPAGQVVQQALEQVGDNGGCNFAAVVNIPSHQHDGLPRRSPLRKLAFLSLS